MARYDQAFYDSGARYDEPVASGTPIDKMAQVKLDLAGKNDLELRTFAENHKAAIDGNADFPTPAPTEVEFDAALANYVAKLAAHGEAEFKMDLAVSELKAARGTMEDLLRSRANYVQETSKGNPAKIQSVSFQIRSGKTPTSALTAPGNVRASIGQNTGEVVLVWDRVLRAVGYIVEYRLHDSVGNWTRVDSITTTKKLIVQGLQSGKQYAFRVRAIGPKQLVSPWSDEAVKMAA
jgi:hypothetical protein